MLGLGNLYATDDACRETIRMLMALSFAPVALVRNAFATLTAGADQRLVPLFDYFQDQWLVRTPVPMWNQYQESKRTNNDLEGWHRRFSQVVSKHHANIWQLIGAFRDEQSATEVTMAQIAAGQIVQKRNKTYEMIQKRIETLTRHYRRGNIALLEFVKGVSHNLAQY